MILDLRCRCPYHGEFVLDCPNNADEEDGYCRFCRDVLALLAAQKNSSPRSP